MARGSRAHPGVTAVYQVKDSATVCTPEPHTNHQPREERRDKYKNILIVDTVPTLLPICHQNEIQTYILIQVTIPFSYGKAGPP